MTHHEVQLNYIPISLLIMARSSHRLELPLRKSLNLLKIRVNWLGEVDAMCAYKLGILVTFGTNIKRAAVYYSYGKDWSLYIVLYRFMYHSSHYAWVNNHQEYISSGAQPNTVWSILNKAIRDGKYLAPPHASAWQRSPHLNRKFWYFFVTSFLCSLEFLYY